MQDVTANLVTNIANAAWIMGGLGLLFGAALALAYRFLRVPEDPRIEMVEEMLPGSNCGACGEPGCSAFAEKIVAGVHPPSKCTVSSPDAVAAIAEALGVDAGAAVKRVARLHCAGGRGRAAQIAAYEGEATCAAAHLVAGGGKGCPWGCMGKGDCEIACGFDAITMSADGLPVVDVDKCTACGDCVDACPRNLFDIMRQDDRVILQCSAPVAGDDARALCTVACDACGRCAQDAAPGLITMERNLPRIDYEGDAPQTPEATLRCPTGAIQWVDGRQLGEPDPTNRARERKSHG